jgi:cytochrome c-type biogenesis protein CcmE
MDKNDFLARKMANYCCRIAAFVFLFGLLSIGCISMFPTPINKILENPRDYDGRPVTISGEVTEAVSLVFIKYFVVKDETGQITVITKRPLPREGSKVIVEGTVQDAFSVGDKQVIVIVEEEKKKT